MPLTKRQIEAANKRRKYGDGRGLFLSVSSKGTKTWAFCYRVPDATAKGGMRAREMGLGSIDDLTLEDARDRAHELRRMVRAGTDPLEHKKGRATKRGNLFRDVAERCVDAKLAAGAWRSPKSEHQWRSTLAAYADPVLGKLDVAAITPEDVVDVLRPIWKDKAETARRVRTRIEAVMDYALASDLRKGDNPARWEGKLKHMLAAPSKVRKVKHHDALPVADLPPFFTLLQAQSGVAARALEFLILTAARTSEVLGATWSEIDLDTATWTIPAERMKAEQEHRVPLSGAAVDLLRALPAEEGSDYLFISPQNAGKPLSNMAMTVLLKRMERKEGVTVHGFRSTFRDWAAETTSYPDAVVEKALAHTIAHKVEAAYRRGDLFDKRKPLMADWAHFCAGRAAGDNVIPIRAGA